MTKLVRWDTGDTIHEIDDDLRATVESAAKLGISCFRARLVGARLDGARLDGARLDGARLDGASLDGASLVGARLDGARLDGASLDGARLPIWCKWTVSYTMTPSAAVAIGCKSKTVPEWDEWFAGSEEFDTPRGSDDFRRIHASYMAVRAYLVVMGFVRVVEDSDG